ncbi:hypothetical protein BRSPCE3_38420 [Bradyrhizobium sp. Ce-3]|nr:hypothetical protein BRSPCE3_38420 [Bradyrhizobium sp. Ce-3]
MLQTGLVGTARFSRFLEMTWRLRIRRLRTQGGALR